jgi:hypothetical protein
MPSTTVETLEALKGQGRVIICGTNTEGVVNLLRYSDETWGIECGGKVVGMWEVREENECFRAFQQKCATTIPAVIKAC